MRGTEKPYFLLRVSIGITPAHAGNSAGGGLFFCVVRDHPRTCGEQYRLKMHFNRVLGSPPHMRGTVALGCVIGVLLRITPAHAGNSTDGLQRFILSEDHPRTCGEQRSQAISMDG